jgi:hypothetical protein
MWNEGEERIQNSEFRSKKKEVRRKNSGVRIQDSEERRKKTEFRSKK